MVGLTLEKWNSFILDLEQLFYLLKLCKKVAIRKKKTILEESFDA